MAETSVAPALIGNPLPAGSRRSRPRSCRRGRGRGGSALGRRGRSMSRPQQYRRDDDEGERHCPKVDLAPERTPTRVPERDAWGLGDNQGRRLCVPHSSGDTPQRVFHVYVIVARGGWHRAAPLMSGLLIPQKIFRVNQFFALTAKNMASTVTRVTRLLKPEGRQSCERPRLLTYMERLRGTRDIAEEPTWRSYGTR